MTQARLQGRLAIVSGGARGIGAAHVRALVGEGARVVIGDVLADEGEALADVNLTGHFPGIRAVLDSMRRAGGGAIVNTSSMTSEIAATYASRDAFPVGGAILAGIMMGE